MRFATALPWWGYASAFGAALVLGWLAYARVPVKLTTGRRLGLSALRALTLTLLIVILLRPIVMVPPAAANNSLLPILVDVSRSMRLKDASTSVGAGGNGPTRIAQAQAMVRDLQAELGKEYRLELLTFGEALSAVTDVDRLAATARRSDLSGAIADLAERHRHDRLAGVIVLSDGGDTASQESGEGRPIGAPVMTVGIGSADAPRDREIVNLTTGEPLLPGASIDVSVSATSSGYGTDPVELRVSANGRPIEVRRLTPAADGAPVHAVFTVSPEPDVATVYTVQIPEAAGEVAVENNFLQLQHVVGPERQRTRKTHLDASPTIVVMAGGYHRHAFDVEVELREVGHRRQGQADVVNLAAAGQQPGHQGLFHGGGIPAVVMADDDAFWHAATRKERGHAKADGIEPHQVDFVGKEPARVIFAKPRRLDERQALEVGRVRL